MNPSGSEESEPLDVLVVGAGFAGVYALHRLRSEGLRVLVVDAADGIGGTWHWNRYPGARCDIESVQYSYSFDDRLEQEWSWSERYAAQPEILEYIHHVADRFELWPDILLNTRVSTMSFDENTNIWTIVSEEGKRWRARYCVMATGPLSVPLEPRIPGLEDFSGEVFRTSSWPKEEPDFHGKLIGLVGTGSSGIQAAPHLARRGRHLTVFQRTPNYVLPAHNVPMDKDYEREWKENYAERRAQARTLRSFALMHNGDEFGAALSDEELEKRFEAQWEKGGLNFSYTVRDFATDARVNRKAAEFVRRKIAERLGDPDLEKHLIPHDYPIGSKRPCVDTDYFETFLRDDVNLVDLRDEPIERVEAQGIRTEKRFIPLDVIVLATGFDAMTGALKAIRIEGRNGVVLKEKWDEAARTFLGMVVAGFPNMFMVNGPGSPSVFTNMVASSEACVDWIANLIGHMRKNDFSVCEVSEDAENEWFDHVCEVGERSLLSKANSWYVGANVPGKRRQFLPYAGGAPDYLAKCSSVEEGGYREFCFDHGVVEKQLADNAT